MGRLSLVILFFSLSVNAADCTRGNNPFQNAKDRMNAVQGQLIDAATALKQGQGEKAGTLLQQASQSSELTKSELEKQSRAMPTQLVTALGLAVKNAKAEEIERVAKAFEAFSMTLSCPITNEPILTSLLPPDPKGDAKVLGYVDYRILAYNQKQGTQLVKEFFDIPLGDCKTCKRGIAMNCGAAKKCEAGLHNGIGMRVFFERSNFRITVKNGTHYRLGSQNELPLPAGETIAVNILSEMDTLTYRVEFSLRKSQ